MSVNSTCHLMALVLAASLGALVAHFTSVDLYIGGR